MITTSITWLRLALMAVGLVGCRRGASISRHTSVSHPVPSSARSDAGGDVHSQLPTIHRGLPGSVHSGIRSLHERNP